MSGFQFHSERPVIPLTAPFQSLEFDHLTGNQAVVLADNDGRLSTFVG